jgi:hypothetical protein
MAKLREAILLLIEGSPLPPRGRQPRVLTRFRDFAVQQRQPLPDGRASVTVVLIQRELQSRDR